MQKGAICRCFSDRKFLLNNYYIRLLSKTTVVKSRLVNRQITNQKQFLKMTKIDMWLHKGSAKDSGYIIVNVLWRQLVLGWGRLRRPGRRDGTGGNDGRRTWKELRETADKRSLKGRPAKQQPCCDYIITILIGNVRPALKGIDLSHPILK